MGNSKKQSTEYHSITHSPYFDTGSNENAQKPNNISEQEEGQKEEDVSSSQKWHTLFLRQRYRITVIISILGMALIIFVPLLLTSVRPRQQTQTNSGQISPVSADGLALNCGKSNIEAQKNGCVFDIMAFAWTPPACFEADLAADGVSEASPLADAHKAGNFQWYDDPNGSISLPQDPLVLSDRYEVWSTNNWHESHCLYFWRLLARAVNRVSVHGIENTYILSEAIYFPHTEHCNVVLADRTTNTSGLFAVFGAKRIYGECVRLDSKPNSYLEHGDVGEKK